MIPKEWKKADIVPIFKKGAKNRPENERFVFLTSITCKMLEHIITRNIMKHLEEHTILTDAQHGILKNRSCESQLIITVQDLAIIFIIITPDKQMSFFLNFLRHSARYHIDDLCINYITTEYGVVTMA